MRARTRTVQRREDRATEDRAVVAACTPKPGGRPRCCRTVVASYQNPAARQGKRSGALWPQAPAPHDPGCARRPPRPLLAPLPCRGCGSLRRASKGSATAQEGSRSCFSALGTEGDGGRGTASSLRLRWCRPSQLSSEGRCGSGCSLQDLGAPSRWVPGLPANPRVSFLLQNTAPGSQSSPFCCWLKFLELCWDATLARGRRAVLAPCA